MASLEQEEARTRPLVRPQGRGRGPGQASLLLLRHKHRPETMNAIQLDPKARDPCSGLNARSKVQELSRDTTAHHQNLFHSRLRL